MHHLHLYLPLHVTLLLTIVTTIESKHSKHTDCLKHFFRQAPPSSPQLDGMPTVCKNNFAIIYDQEHKVPALVAYSMRFQRSKTFVPAEGDWGPDDLLPKDVQAADADYTNSGYNRGHLVPAKTLSYSCEAEMSTYTFANAAPQNPASNKGEWLKTERFLRNFVASHKNHDVFVLTGVLFDSSTTKTTMKKSDVSVPDFFWTANWDPSFKNSDGTYGIGWGFVVANQEPTDKNHPDVLTIKEIEEKIKVVQGGSVNLFEGSSKLASFFGGHTIEAAHPMNRNAWEQDLLRVWDDALPPFTEPAAALPDILERCQSVCERVEVGIKEGKFSTKLSTREEITNYCKNDFQGTKEDHRLCFQIMEQLLGLEKSDNLSSSSSSKSGSKRGRSYSSSSSRRSKRQKNELLLVELESTLSNACSSACRRITDPHENFYVAKAKNGKVSSRKYYSGELMVAEMIDGSEKVLTAMREATNDMPMELTKFGTKLSEMVYGGLSKDRHLKIWPTCDMQLEQKKPVLELDLGGRLLVEPVLFRGVLRGVKYACVGFQLEGTKYVYGLFTGAKRVAVLCENYTVKKWCEAFDNFHLDEESFVQLQGQEGEGGKKRIK